MKRLEEKLKPTDPALAWEKKNEDPPFVLMQAFIFPYINLLWLGAILMGIGTLLAVWKRVYRALNQTRK